MITSRSNHVWSTNDMFKHFCLRQPGTSKMQRD